MARAVKAGTRKVVFKLIAPYANSVSVAGDFNNWTPTNYPSRREKSQYFCTVPLRPGKYRYKFVLNGNNWQPAPNAPFELDPWGGKNSILTVE